MTEATQQGADIHSAARAIEGLLDAGSSPLPDDKPQHAESSKEPVQDAQAESIPEEQHAEGNEQHESSTSESEPTEHVETQESDAEFELPQSFDQLAESMGVEADKLFNLKVKTKIDGQDGEATLADLIKSYQLEGHINKKSMALSEQQKAFEAELAQHKQNLTERFEQAETYTQLAQNELMREFNSVNWQELRIVDPAEFAAKQLEFSNRQHAIQQAATQVQQQKLSEQQRMQQEHQQYMQKFHAEQKNLLLSKIPEWSNAEKMQTEDKEISKYLVSQGFDVNEVKSISDHKQVIIARKAWLYDKLISSKPQVLNQVKKQPTFIKPGSTKGKSEIISEQRAANLKQVRKSGRVEDAAKAIADLFK